MSPVGLTNYIRSRDAPSQATAEPPLTVAAVAALT